MMMLVKMSHHTDNLYKMKDDFGLISSTNVQGSISLKDRSITYHKKLFPRKEDLISIYSVSNKDLILFQTHRSSAKCRRLNERFTAYVRKYSERQGGEVNVFFV